MLNRPKPLVLLILDVFGYSLEQENNAIATANTPCWDQLQKDYPMTLLDCSGRSVGLPHEQMGNKETWQAHTAHITDQVPCGDKLLAHGSGLSDLAPTILGVDQPTEMTGISLINAA